MNELLNKQIKVSEIKVNQGNIKIVDGQGLTYTIWETKKDGDKTVAYKTYEGLGNIMGKSLEIGYDEKDIPESQGKYRNIKTMKLVAGENMGVGQGINLTTPLERPQSNFKPSSTLTNERPQQENTYNQEIDKKALPTQSQEIRANVALKMVSEIIASGQIGLEEWKKYADEFYNYKP